MTRLTRTESGSRRITAVRYRRFRAVDGVGIRIAGHDAGIPWGPGQVAISRDRRAYVEAGGRVGYLGFRSVPILHDPPEVS